MSADLDIVPVRGDETDDLLNMLFDEKGSPLLDEMDASKDGLPVLDSVGANVQNCCLPRMPEIA